MKALACGLLAALADAPVQAQPFALTWQAPAECPSEAEVSARLQRELPAGPLPQVRAEVGRRGAQLVLQLAIEHEGRSVTRELRARDCEPLVAGTATLVALTLGAQPTAPRPPPAQPADPLAPGSPPPDSPPAGTQPLGLPTLDANAPAQLDAPAVPPGEASSLEAAASEAAALPGSARQPWGLRAALGGGLLSSGTPSARPTLFAQLGAQYAALSLDLRVGHAFAATRAISADASLRLVSQFIALSACAQWGARGLSAGPCVAMQGTRIHASSRGLDGAHAHDSLWAQLGLGAGARYAFARRGELGLEAGLLLPLSARPEFRADGRASAIAQADVVSGYGHLGLGMRFE